MKVNIQEFRSEDWDFVHQTLPANRSGAMYVKDLFQFCAYTRWLFVSALKAIRYGVKIALVCRVNETRGSRLSPIKTKTCRAGEDFSKSGRKRLMW